MGGANSSYGGGKGGSPAEEAPLVTAFSIVGVFLQQNSEKLSRRKNVTRPPNETKYHMTDIGLPPEDSSESSETVPGEKTITQLLLGLECLWDGKPLV